jgi:hydroxymethylpyrimidine kinase/phosphomethylpyrimidine kinase
MRQPAPVRKPVTLTIAGSDSGGGAGIQADLKTMEACDTFGTSVITALTAQNTQGVESSFVVPTTEIEAQIDAVLSDFDVAGVKTGMLATADVIEVVTEYARSFECPLVVDPVMVATSGDRLLDEAAEEAYEDLVSAATLVTPNADEAAVLTGIEPTDEEEARDACERLLEMGSSAALVTGGHIPGPDDADEVLDVLVTDGISDKSVNSGGSVDNDGSATSDGSFETYRHPRIETDATHGSGCTLSSAITARLAQEDDLFAAVEYATHFMERATRYPHDVGNGPGAVHHLAALREQAARQPVQETIENLVGEFVRQNVRSLVPEVGMNVVGATPYAETTGEVAAVEGRITKTIHGVHPNRGVRFGASSHVARFLLSLREHDPSICFGVNCRFGDDIECALDALDWTIAEYDRSEEPDPDVEGSTMGWGARQAFESVDGTPTAIVDRGDIGKEPIVKVFATNGETLHDRTMSLLDSLEREQ